MQTDNVAMLVDFGPINEGFWKYNKKYSGVCFKISDNNTNHLEIQPLDWHLKDISNYILGAILYLKKPTVKEISYTLLKLDGKERLNPYEQEAFYHKIYRKIVKLLELDLITPASASLIGNFDRYSIAYKLSFRGLFYSLLNWCINPFLGVGPKIILDQMLKTYYDNPLLKYFLSPHFKRHSLENADDEFSYELAEYLSEICKDIVVIKRRMVMSKESLINDALPDHLFTWPSADAERKYNYEKFFRREGNFRQFLTRELKWSWIFDADIKPDFENNLITIKDNLRGHQALIKIDRQKKSVVLIRDKKKILPFKVSLNRGNLQVMGKSEINEHDISESLLRYSSIVHLFELILSIKTKYKIKSNRLYKSLENDEIFKKSVRDLISLIDIST